MRDVIQFLENVCYHIPKWFIWLCSKWNILWSYNLWNIPPSLLCNLWKQLMHDCCFLSNYKMYTRTIITRCLDFTAPSVMSLSTSKLKCSGWIQKGSSCTISSIALRPIMLWAHLMILSYFFAISLFCSPPRYYNNSCTMLTQWYYNW